MKRSLTLTLTAILLCLSVVVTVSNADPLPLPPSPQDVWLPAPGTTWQWQLTETINTTWNVQMYDIDLFETPVETITELHGDGRIVICYMSAGSYEDWRPDAGDFPSEVLGNLLDGWPSERWLDIRRIDLLSPIMTARMDLAVEKGCDGIEPDNIDGYNNDSGFPLTYNDQITYNVWLAAEAHNRDLSIGLKNDLDQIPDLVSNFDWALNEQCFQYQECDTLLPFIDAGKAVFGVEYEGDPAVYCPQAVEMGFSWLTKTLDLGDEPPNACTGNTNPPDVPQLTAPGDGSTIAAYAPLFTWTGGNTTIFKFILKTSEGVKVLKKQLAYDAICTESDCAYDSVIDAASLTNQAYQWKVIAKNIYGKAKSAKFTFTVDFPGAPIVTSPGNGDTVSTTPTVTWNEVDLATEYRVIFKNLDAGGKLKGNWTVESTLCTGGSCSYTPVEALAAGSYKLWVQARTTDVPNKSSSAKIVVQVTE
ncbi:MAG TPA: endo alpha-1,4 polygalactosaminidase [Phototrophicaceae bacterium]|jgi:hypothetical protein|nr:endo alpha-1,4 polygalactosaminidase [Phototrophicaceae bacterium]